MMKRILISVVAALLTVLANAQTFRYGVTAGLNLNYQHGSDNDYRAGWRAGLAGQLDLKSCWYMSASLQLDSRSFKSGNYNNEVTSPLYYTSTINYLSLPIHAGYAVPCGEKVKVLFEAGPYFALGLWGKSAAHGVDGKEIASTKDFDQLGVERFDCGLGLAVGTELFRHYQLKVGYDFGLTKTRKYDADKCRNSLAYVTLSYMF